MPVNLIPQSHLPLRKRYLKEESCSALFAGNSESSFQETISEEDNKTKCSSKVNIKIECPPPGLCLQKVVVPGVIRHTSHPTHALAYYKDKDASQH